MEAFDGANVRFALLVSYLASSAFRDRLPGMSRHWTKLLAVLVATALVYLPGLSGGFAFDDYPNIVTNTSVSEATLDIDDLAQAAWSGAAGPLRRPIAMLSFALNYATSGDAPLPFKLTNLIIHLVAG